MATEATKLYNSFRFPFFELKNVDRQLVKGENYIGENGILIAFICNHCPYVVGNIKHLIEDAKSLKDIEINTVAINSNDAEAYPDDSFENMVEFSKKNNFTFPYLIDETQKVAKKFGAVCTPDFFLFTKKDDELILSHKGRLNDFNRSKSDPETFQPQRELLTIAQYLVGQNTDEKSPIITDYLSGKSSNSMGCSIKWKASPSR